MFEEYNITLGERFQQDAARTDPTDPRTLACGDVLDRCDLALPVV